MFIKGMYLATLCVYVALAGVLLAYVEANVLWIILFLSALPTLLFWYLEDLNTKLLPIILIISLGATTLFEVVAYTNGLWYELSPTQIRVFGMVPLASFVAAFSHLLFYVVVYEYFFDDRKSPKRQQPKHLPYLVSGVGILLALALGYVYVFSGVFMVYPFALFVVLAFLVFLGAVVIFRGAWKKTIKKAGLFALAVYPISVVYELVSLHSDVRFFANINEYLYTFTIFGEALPLEELVFIFLIPLWLAVVYELYLDDGK